MNSLDNTELSHVYYYFRDYLISMDETLKSGFTTKKIDVNIPGVDISVQPFVSVKISEEEIEAIRNSNTYMICKKIVEKLRPIVELIEEAEPEIKKLFDDE